MAAPSYLAWWVAVLLVPCVPAQETPTPVNTSAGLILGKMSKVKVRQHTVIVETFWGIPYAKPPIGNLRFKKTQPVEPWTGVRNAWDPPKACIQKVDNDVITSPEQMSEDCLYLNIWRPYCSETNMTTMVWIHGGGLTSGSSADPRYNGEILAARQCVIVASMNYRLGAFGFLSMHEPDHRGNAGLFDVLSALRFLHTNIEVFGGDKSNITLFGAGAGAYIISTFLMSTLGRDLFRNAILQDLEVTLNELLGMMYKSQTVKHIANILKQLYGYNKLKKKTRNPGLHFLSKVCRDVSYRCPQKALIDKYAELGSRVYVYSFDRAPQFSDLPKWIGATHGSEIRYIFRSAHTNQSENFVDDEISLSRKMMKMWANFAKTGNPNEKGNKTRHWKPFMPGQKIMIFTEKAKIKSSKDKHAECDYWNSLPDLMVEDFVSPLG